MEGFEPWLARPVILSSTLRNTHPRKGDTRHQVFPKLAKNRRESRRHLKAIDLRTRFETIESVANKATDWQVRKTRRVSSA